MSDSIFGSQAPKFVCSGTTVLLDHWVADSEDDTDRSLAQESEITPERDIFDRGSFLEIKGRIFLFQYGDSAAQLAKFTEINAFNRQKVTLWKHRDGVNYKDVSNNDVLFYMTITPGTISPLDNNDILTIVFRSLTAVDYGNSL